MCVGCGMLCDGWGVIGDSDSDSDVRSYVCCAACDVCDVGVVGVSNPVVIVTRLADLSLARVSDLGRCAGAGLWGLGVGWIAVSAHMDCCRGCVGDIVGDRVGCIDCGVCGCSCRCR